MKRLTTLLVICSASSAASAWSLWGAAAAMARHAETDTTSDVAPAIPCLGAFSKDGCDGYIDPGPFKSVGCNTNDCRTLVFEDAVYVTDMRSSNLACNPTCNVGCDAFPDGRLTLKFDFVLRADSCCPYRGSWIGEWEYTTVAGRVFSGRAHGTIGVGTNRVSQCSAGHDNCEQCYDVQLSPSGYQIGFEGSFRGTAQSSTLPFPRELNFTMDGTWLVPVDPAAPFTVPFSVYNRFDGVSITYCQ